MKKALVFLLITVLAGLCAYGSSLWYFQKLTKDIKNCPAVKNLVCAYDDYTYVNECFMQQAGATKRYDGPCSAENDALHSTSTVQFDNCDIRCVRYDPVCGTDGVTYACGEAETNCKKVEIAYKDECKVEEGCICTMEYAPVCGKDGKTYGNACGARCAKVEIDYTGECGDTVSNVDPCLFSDMESREKCKLKQ